ncbi:MAG TPA: hypothetical protein VEL06_16635 [Haliangiales bacterium]|nr:hypothetical protein [Haliangiales bacterium]
MSATKSNAAHTWKFFRAGGFDQVRLDTGADLMALDQLDQKLWVALACPTRGLEFDTKTLDLIDTDKDGRIRAPDIIAATRWAGSCLKNPDDLLKSSPSLPLSAINEATPEGKQLFSSARQILANLGKKDAPAITIDDTTDTTKIFARTVFNGDGIIPADSAGDEMVKSVINDIIACLGPDTDRSGKPGVSQARADQFFAEAQAFSDWWKKGENDANVFPLGEATAGGYAAMKTVKAKIDDYFARCRLAAFDSRALAAVNRQEAEYLALAAKDLTITSAEIAGFPVARVEVNKPLPLKEGVNPAWAEAVARFQAEVVTPLIGEKPALTEADWTKITARFAAFEGWLGGKAGAAVERLGLKRVREILASHSREAIAALVAKDKALEPEASAIAAVDKLVRYHRDLCQLLNNFVSFRDFYRRKDKALFQVGTLYLDQRSCELCVRVDDAGKHAALAGLAKTCLAYCDLTRKSTGEKMTIAAAFTAGDSDNLMVGRNGIFYDRQGRDWDATITKIIENPIGVHQAFWAPYKRFVRLIEEQIAKRAAAADAAATEKLAVTASVVAGADKIKPAEPKKLDTGTVAALGVGLGSLATALGVVFSKFADIPTWKVPFIVIGAMLAISLPSMVIAWLKLRQRNLGPILDANGWAVNARAKINIPFGASLTGVAKLPPGTQRDLFDPFAESHSARDRIIALIVLAGLIFGLWYFGALHKVMPGLPKSSYLRNLDKARSEAKEKAAKDAAATAPAPSTNAPATPAPAK